MNIAHVTFGLGLGGIETMLVNIANEQVRSGHRVDIVILNDVVDPQLRSALDPRVGFHNIGRNPAKKSVVAVLKLNSKLRKLAPDVIHLHYARIARLLFGKSLRSKLCVTLHNMCRPFNIKSLDIAGPVFAISGMVKDDIQAKTGLASTVVFNGIKAPDIAPRTYRRPDDVLRIVQVSRLLLPDKGQDILIEALGQLVAQGIDNVHLTLIGDGPSRQELEQLVERLALGKYVEFAGARPQEYVYSHLRDYDLFVQPSRFDGFALTVAEAMVAKLPVLVCDDQAPYEVIGYGRYGAAFKGGDAKACADGIRRFVEAYPAEAAIDEAAAFATANYSVAATAANYIEQYKNKVLHSDKPGKK